MKPKNPYTALLERAKEFAFKVKYRHTVTALTFERSKLESGYRLDTVPARICSANILGYDTKLVLDSDGNIVMQFVKRVDIPWEFNQ